MNGEILNSIRAAGLGFGSRVLFGLPDPVLNRIFGDPPEVAAGLRPDAWALCRIFDLIEGFTESDDPVAMRIETELLAHAVADRSPLPVSTDDLDLGPAGQALPARLYVPAGAPEDGPLLIWFHGGGWVVGSIVSHDFSCRRLAHNTGARVLSVGYRLGPEHPFPAAADDALAAWDAVEADPGRFGTSAGLVAVGGDSAGGNLAAVVCQDLRAAGREQPAFQVLVYPVTEIGCQSQSMSDYSTGYYLTEKRMNWFDERYAPGAAGDEVRASPLKAERFDGLARAYINTCIADPLRDEGESYARKLMEAGVETRLDRFPLVHAWFNQTLARSSRAAHDVMAGRIRQMSDQSPSAG